ncbi:acetyl-CoA synthetase-like protein [Panus rudis PR-1116 ss-1]|nr:acetyl-CoA synthetase-like protein [Panus rudis PR-1116 ss-1]
MPFFRTHLTALEESAALYPTSPAFRVPEVNPVSQEIVEWHAITYQQFLADVEHTARYWTDKLNANEVPPRSVVGLWLGGMTYVDAVQIYGIARAGYIPQLFSLRLPNPDVIFELLQKSNGKALIYDPSFADTLSSSPIPAHIAVDARSVAVPDILLPSTRPDVDGEETLMIFHTSGSTSGQPKVVPCSYAWWQECLRKSAISTKPYQTHRQDVTVWMGSMCHIGQTFMFSGFLQHGSCTIQISSQAFPTSELIDMITRCHLNRLVQFPTFLSSHLRASRQDPKLLDMLKNLDEIFYSGMLLTQDDQEWIHRHGLKVVNCFGSTECGAMMLSDRDWKGKSAPLCPIEGTSYGFFPIDESESPNQNVNARMLELVILSDSKDCPDRSLRSSDGHYHTGDLFIEVAPGRYVSRGRNDDWIKSENSLRCDTKAIEDHVRTTCGDLIADCIVVGNGRPSPALFVEPKAGTDEDKLKKEIIRRTRHFHSRRYLHERITSPKFIIVAPAGSLPRTASKGNIRRRAVEETFKAELDRLYNVNA